MDTNLNVFSFVRGDSQVQFFSGQSKHEAATVGYTTLNKHLFCLFCTSLFKLDSAGSCRMLDLKLHFLANMLWK